MANVYSVELWDSGGAVPAGSYESSIIPAGYRWIVRDMEVTFTGDTQLTLLQGVVVSSSIGGPWMIALDVPRVKGTAYEWHGHQVFDAGNRIELFTGDDGWAWRFSGYQLTLP